MAQIITGISQSKVLSSLDTYNHTAGAAQMYTVNVKMSELPPSGLSIVIQQNGSPMATSVAPAATQGELDLRIVLNCAISDVISVILSSSNVQEAGRNQIKGILNITPGIIG
jgi:hypothetical protein